MPIREFACQTPGCPKHWEIIEHFFHHSEDPVLNSVDMLCPVCAQPGLLLASPFGIVFTGPLTARYNDPKRPYPHREGQWVWERNTPDGRPRARFLETFDDQRDYCRQEGLVNPKELPAHARLVTTDDHDTGLRRLLELPPGDTPGKKLTLEEIRKAGGVIKQELRSRGLPGQEV